MLALYGRPDTWNWLLMFHIFTALALVAGTFVVASASVAALGSADQGRVTLLRRVALRTNLALVLPAFIAVIVLGATLADKEYPGDTSPGWLDVGWHLTEGAGVVGGILLSLLQWWVVRRARAGQTRGWQAQVASYVAPLVFAAILVVLFLMSGKPD
jgi:hypothetical protein